jgi:hypothetical protein
MMMGGVDNISLYVLVAELVKLCSYTPAMCFRPLSASILSKRFHFMQVSTDQDSVLIAPRITRTSIKHNVRNIVYFDNRQQSKSNSSSDISAETHQKHTHTHHPPIALSSPLPHFPSGNAFSTSPCVSLQHSNPSTLPIHLLSAGKPSIGNLSLFHKCILLATARSATVGSSPPHNHFLSPLCNLCSSTPASSLQRGSPFFNAPSSGTLPRTGCTTFSIR